MFDAAHAALLWSGAQAGRGEIKKHTNLIAAFGRHIVQKGLLPVEFGKALNQAERIRRLADYTGDPIELDRAAVEVEQAERFVDAVNARFKDGASAD